MHPPPPEVNSFHQDVGAHHQPGLQGGIQNGAIVSHALENEGRLILFLIPYPTDQLRFGHVSKPQSLPVPNGGVGNILVPCSQHFVQVGEKILVPSMPGCRLGRMPRRLLPRAVMVPTTSSHPPASDWAPGCSELSRPMAPVFRRRRSSGSGYAGLGGPLVVSRSSGRWRK